MVEKLTYEELEQRVKKFEKEAEKRKQTEETLSFERAQLFSIFDSMLDGVYVSDIDTSEILYVSQSSKDAFQKELIGGICYEEFQGLDSPCEFCTNEIIVKQKPAPHRWEYHNPLLDKDYAIVDRIITWPDGREVRLEIALNITEHKRADEQIKLLTSALEQSAEGIALADLDGHLTYLNKAFATIHGYNTEELIGKHVSVFHTPEQIPSVEASLQQLKDHGEFNGELWHVRRDGTVFPSLMHNSLVFDDAGQPIIMIGTLRDITELKDREESLKRQSRILEQVHDSIVTTDMEGLITGWNRGAETLHGFSAKEVLGRSVSSLFSDEHKSMFVDIVLKELADENEYNLETPMVHKSGGIFWAHLSLSILRGLDGEPIGTIGYAVDTSERKKADEAIRESEERFRALFENAADAFFLSDINGRFIDINQVACDNLGYTREELLELSIPEVDLNYDSNEVAAIQNGFDQNESKTIESFHKRKDGSTFPVEVRIRPFGPDQRPMILALARDITDRKNAEEEKEKLETQLRQSHKMEALGTLAGGIAHEFNNILGIIVGNTELAMGGVPEWNTAHYNLEEIHTASLRARDIVKQILAFSRQTKHELKPVKIRSLIDDSIKFARSSIPTNIEIQKDISAKLDTINGDPTQINQILLNLCTNAAHAMQNNGGILKIRLENVDLDENTVKKYDGLNSGNHVKLTVSDTGHGIEKKKIEHIFDPFFTTKEVGEGSGMGLSVVHGIVKEHKGSITVQSEAGKGTTFHVLFPVIEEQAQPEPESRDPLLKGHERILFVDDEKTLVLATKNNLEGMGYEVVAKRDPIKALGVFKEQPDEFDLVITDMTMPNMTGDRLASEIMKIRTNTPIIVCTGHSDRMSENRAKEMGIRGYVMKPYLSSEIAMTIRQVLDKRKEVKPIAEQRILVVDDEEQMRSLIRQILEGCGYEVSEAPDGNVALWLFKEKPSDLIITDLIMPKKEGLETIMELKKDVPDVKIIAISGGGHGDKRQYLDMAKKMGADSTLAKPFEKEELLKAVKDLLG